MAAVLRYRRRRAAKKFRERRVAIGDLRYHEVIERYRLPRQLIHMLVIF